jgi:tetratricopeptide (TPR) repeat protein
VLGTGAAEKALARANEAIVLNPNLASAWALRGRVYWRMNQTDRGLADLQRALQFAPDSSDVLMDVAAIYRQRGQHDRCLTTLHHLLDTYPPGQATQLAYWMEGLTLADLGRPEQAVESLEIANRHGPANADIWYYLAQAQLACGRPDAATTAAQQALAVNPTHAPSRELLAELAVHTGPSESLVR